MVSQVQTNRLSQPFCPLEPHTVRDTDDAKRRNGVLTNAAAINGSVFGGCLARTANLGMNAIAPLLTAASGIALGSLHVFDILSGSNGNLARIRNLEIGAITSLTTAVSLVPLCSLLAYDILCASNGNSLAVAISQSAINGVKTVVDYAKVNPIPSALSILNGGLGMTLFKYRGHTHSQAVGSGLLLATAPCVLDHVGKTIYTSFTAQDGYCRRAITQIDNAISESKENGWIKDVLDYAHENPITTAASAIAGISGSIFGPLYWQTTITHVGALAYNAMMTATISAAAQNGPVAQPIIQAAYSAADNAYYHTILRQTLGIGFVTGWSAATVPHVVNFISENL